MSLISHFLAAHVALGGAGAGHVTDALCALVCLPEYPFLASLLPKLVIYLMLYV